MCNISFTNNIKIVILAGFWKRPIFQYLDSWTAIWKSLCCVESIIFFKKNFKLLIFAHTTEYY